MKILFVSHKYPPTHGGMEKHSYHLIAEFRDRRDCEAIALTIQPGESQLHFILRYRKCIRELLLLHPDIKAIHLNDALLAILCQDFSRKYDLIVIANVHGLDFLYPFSLMGSFVLRRLTRLTGLICVSNFTKEICIEKGLPKSKLIAINNGVDHQIKYPVLNPFHERALKRRLGINSDHKRILLSIGRPVKRKGFSWFVKNVMPELPNDIVLVIAGPIDDIYSLRRKVMKLLSQPFGKLWNMISNESSDLDDLLESIQRNKLGSRVIMTGQLVHRDLMGLIEMSEAFVMPNVKIEDDAEGFGLVALEAALKSKLVLASELEGLTDAITHQKNGILLPSNDVRAWVETILSWINDPGEMASFGKEARDYTLENYSWSKMANEYYQFIRSKVIESETRVTELSASLQVA